MRNEYYPAHKHLEIECESEKSKIRYVILLLFLFLTLQIKWVKTLMSLLTAQVTINSFFPTMSCINFYLINIENKKFPLQTKTAGNGLK